MANFVRFIDTLSYWIARCVSYLVLVLIFIVVYEVVARYAFRSPTTWSMELSTFIFAAVWLFAGAEALHQKAHIRIDIFYSRLSPRKAAILDVLTAPGFFIMVGVVIWVSFRYALVALEMREHAPSSWGPPIYIVKFLIPLGAFLLLIEGITIFISNLYKSVKDKTLNNV